jgi:hypothetical protein
MLPFYGDSMYPMQATHTVHPKLPPDDKQPVSYVSDTAISSTTELEPSVKRKVMTEEVNRHRSALRWWLVSCIAFVCLTPFVSVMCGLHLHARDMSYQPHPPPPPFDGRTILMEVVLVDADPKSQTVTLDWTFMGEETSPCNTADLAGCTNVNLFFDR